MNEKGMELFTAMDGASDAMLADALPPDMGAYAPKQKKARFSGFFERPWVAAVISAAVALAVLTGIVWAGRDAAEKPWNPEGEIGGNPIAPEENAQTDVWPDYDNPPVPENAKIIVSSGGYTIAPAEYIQWKQTWNAEMGEMEEERGFMQWSSLMPELDSGGEGSLLMSEISDLPCIPYAYDFQLSVSNRPLEMLSASAYKTYQQSYKFAYGVALDTGLTVEDLMKELSEGSYYILVVAYERGETIESVGKHEGTMYEFVFRIDVYGNASFQPPEDGYTEDFEPVDIKVCVQSAYKAVALKPYLVTAVQYNEKLGGWRDVDGEGLADVLSERYGELPILVYDDGFHVYIKEIDGIATPRYLSIYDEGFNEIGKYKTPGTSFPWYIGELAALSKGNYYVVLEFHQTGITVGEETERGSYEYGFKLMVDPAMTTPPEAETHLTLDLGVEVLAGHDYSPFVELSPHVNYVGFYHDEKEEWVYEEGEELERRLPELGGSLPVITYNNTFRMYTEKLRPSEDEREYSLEFTEYVVYGSNYDQVLVCHDVTEDLYMLSTLQPGTYYVVLDALLIRRILPEGWEKGEYQFGFKLIVPHLGDDTPSFTTGDLTLTSGGNRVEPARRNEWTEDQLEKELNALPVLFLDPDEECHVTYSSARAEMIRLTVYQTEGGVLGSQVMQISTSDFSALSTLQDGIYCVSFMAEDAVSEDLLPDMVGFEEFVTCEYAFVLYKGYAGQEAE